MLRGRVRIGVAFQRQECYDRCDSQQRRDHEHRHREPTCVCTRCRLTHGVTFVVGTSVEQLSTARTTGQDAVERPPFDRVEPIVERIRSLRQFHPRQDRADQSDTEHRPDLPGIRDQ